MQYFSCEKGLLTRLLWVKFLSDETLKTVNFSKNSLFELLVKWDKSYCFWFRPRRCLHKGAEKVYSKLKQNMGNSIGSVGCPAHILHNAAQIIYNVLSVDTVVTLLWNCSLTSALILAMLYCLYWAIKFFCVWFCWHYSIVSKNLLALFSKYIWRNPCFIT